MALDRIIHFSKPNEVPARLALVTLLEDYFAGLGTVTWKRDRFYCTIPGKGSRALRRIVPAPLGPDPEERWIEVWYDETRVDIITRSADDITNAIAEGLAEIIARFWRGVRTR